MWWGIGIGVFLLYLVVLFTLGFTTLRNGHGWMFFFGIFFPLLWLFGALWRRGSRRGHSLLRPWTNSPVPQDGRKAETCVAEQAESPRPACSA